MANIIGQSKETIPDRATGEESPLKTGGQKKYNTEKFKCPKGQIWNSINKKCEAALGSKGLASKKTGGGRRTGGAMTYGGDNVEFDEDA